jgi:hypothetical protein
MPGDSDLRHWLLRAEEARAKAHDTKDPRLKRRMLGLADFYERLAEQIEQTEWKRNPAGR